MSRTPPIAALGGPSNPDPPDLAPDAWLLVQLLQKGVLSYAEPDHLAELSARRQSLWLAIRKHTWMPTAAAQGLDSDSHRIDLETVEQLRAVSFEGRSMLLRGEPVALVTRATNGVRWAVLEPIFARALA